MSSVNDDDDTKTAQDITYDEWVKTRENMGILSPYMSDKEIEITDEAFQIIGEHNLNLIELYDKENLSGLTEVSEDDKKTLKKALTILKDNGCTPEWLMNCGRFAQTLKTDTKV